MMEMARHERALRLAEGELKGESNGAEGGTRTPTVLLPPAPQAGASANSATSARRAGESQDSPPRSGYFAGVSAGGAGVAGAGAGVVGAGVGFGGKVDAGGGAGARAGARPPITEPGPRWPTIPRTSAPTTNSTAQTVVARDSTVAPLRAPNAA